MSWSVSVRGASDAGGHQAGRIYIRRGECLDDPAVAQHEYSVAYLGQFLDLARDEDDALSGCSELADDCVNLAFGFDVDATCRLVEQKQAGAGIDPPTDNDLLLVT